MKAKQAWPWLHRELEAEVWVVGRRIQESLGGTPEEEFGGQTLT